MSGKTLIKIENPVTQSVEAVKSLLTWRGRGTDPMPATVEFVNEGDESRLVLVLSNKKDSYYVVTPVKCSCPSATYHSDQPCKHQRKHFGAKLEQAATVAESGSIRPECKWPGGLNGPVDECKGVA